MNKYAKYKPSCIEWLGDIPEHWKVKRVKDIAEINKNSLNEKTPKDRANA